VKRLRAACQARQAAGANRSRGQDSGGRSRGRCRRRPLEFVFNEGIVSETDVQIELGPERGAGRWSVRSSRRRLRGSVSAWRRAHRSRHHYRRAAWPRTGRSARWVGPLGSRRARVVLPRGGAGGTAGREYPPPRGCGRLKLRVAALTTLVSPREPALTAVQLTVDVVGRLMRVRLPDARLQRVRERGEARRSCGATSIAEFSPRTDVDRSAAVRLVYPAGQAIGTLISWAGWRTLACRVAAVVVPTATLCRSRSLVQEVASAGRFRSPLRACRHQRRWSRKGRGADRAGEPAPRGGERQQAGEMLTCARRLSVDEATNGSAIGSHAGRAAGG
jgi:hypothetical protein